MARAIWTGSISFGLVSIPVGLHAAVSEKNIRFHQLEKGTSDRIRYKRVNESTGEEVDYHDIVKGYEVGDGEYVVLTQRELEAVEPAGGKNLEIEDFVDQADIDPIFYNQTYYIGPRSDAAARPYALLVEAMRSSGKAAIARIVLRTKEHLAVLRVKDDVLALETMYFADEIRDPAGELDYTKSVAPAHERELSTAVSLIDSMSSKWDPTNYHDRYRERVEELIDAKREGEEVVTAQPREQATNVVDLMDALRRSVDQARERRDGDAEPEARQPEARQPEARQPAARQPAARRPAAKRAEARTKAPEAPSTAPAEKSRRGRGRKARVPQGEQLAMMSRDELYQMAQEVNVPGRSKMKRDELVEAIAKRADLRAS